LEKKFVALVVGLANNVVVPGVEVETRQSDFVYPPFPS
jgi:hypothetical protein